MAIPQEEGGLPEMGVSQNTAGLIRSRCRRGNGDGAETKTINGFIGQPPALTLLRGRPSLAGHLPTVGAYYAGSILNSYAVSGVKRAFTVMPFVFRRRVDQRR